MAFIELKVKTLKGSSFNKFYHWSNLTNCSLKSMSGEKNNDTNDS